MALAWPAATEQPRLESIEVAVTTGEGSTVAGLTSDDFEVLVDGKPAPIQKLVPPPAPVTVIVLFDVTASMTNYGDIGVEIERSLVPALRPGDRARIGGIANRLVLSPAFTSVRKELIDEGRKALDFRRGDKYGPSPIWDALQESVRALEPEPGRRGIVLVSDGRATGNTIAATEAIESAILAGTVVQVLSEARTMYLWQGKDSVCTRSPGPDARRDRAPHRRDGRAGRSDESASAGPGGRVASCRRRDRRSRGSSTICGRCTPIWSPGRDPPAAGIAST